MLNKFTAAALAATAIAGFGTSAFAADYGVRRPAPAPVPVVAPYYPTSGSDWSGFYAGVFAGYGNGSMDWTLTSPGDNFSGDIPLSGYMLGATLGANAQFGQFVLGVEGDIAWSGISGTGAAINGSEPGFDINWLGTLRGRAGIALDSVLVYGTAGWAYGGATASLTNYPSSPTTTTRDTSVSGFVAGVGAEVAVTDTLSVKAEYLYHGLKMAEVEYDPATALANGDLGLHTFKVGLNFGF